MLLKIRKKIPLFLSLCLLFIGVSLSVAAQSVVTPPSYVTDAEMKSFVYPTIIGALATALAGFAGVLAFILNREHGSSKEDREVQREQFSVVGKAITNLGETVGRVIIALQEHNDSPNAHLIARDISHDPIHTDISEIKERLNSLVSEHHFIHNTEEAMCGMLRRRDPRLSPRLRRATDPETFDGRDLRGKEPLPEQE